MGCVNHDKYAIISHAENHKYSIHFTEDVRDWKVIVKLESLIKKLRARFPGAIICFHASLECTHFSNAKGGDSRDADSRTLGDHLYKYLVLSPDYITIENVVEFKTWGPLGENKLPIKERKGESYEAWKNVFISKGYKYENRTLNAADFGAYTSRKRYFGCFALGDLPIVFPTPTHITKSKHPQNLHLKVHNAVKDKLDLADQGVSVLGTNKQGKEYSDKTLLRVLGGLKKFTTKEQFISSYYGAAINGQGVHSVDEPCRTITTKDRFALHHIQYAYGKPTYSPITAPSQVITTTPKQELVTSHWLFDHQFGNKGSSIDLPSPTIIARQDKKPLYIAAAKAGSTDKSIQTIGDSAPRRLLRWYMRRKGISDITIRTLHTEELKRIQGFPEDYVLKGGITRAKKYIGNSVSPPQAEANSNALYGGYVKYANTLTHSNLRSNTL